VKALRRGVFVSGVATLCAWIIVPLYLLALGAVGGRQAVESWPKSFWPQSLSFGTLASFMHITGVWEAAGNSLQAALLCMLFSVLLGVPAGYALARFAFPGATLYRMLILLTRAFPVAILALPLTVSFIRLGVYDTPLGVSLVHTALALPFAVLVSASLFQAIPRELEEAAWVFGCSKTRAFLRVMLPLSAPGLVATSIFAFVISWNEVFAASVLTVRHKTLTAYLLSVLSESPLQVQFAGGFVLILPSVVFIFLVRKHLFAMWGIANR
jgi:multiple sugar transport system permease protein